MNLPDLSCIFVNGFGDEMVEVGGADVVRGGKESARVAPKSAAAGEPWRDCLLALLVEVLAQVSGGAHVPGHEVGTFLLWVVLPSGLPGVEVKSEVFGAVWFGDMVPGFGKLPLKAAHVVWEA